MSAMRRARGFTRRQFLGGTLGVAAAWGPTGISTLMGPGSTRTAPLEGIYTDRFTSRQGEPIVVHACLSDVWAAPVMSTGAPVDLALHHVDVVAPFLAGTGLQAGDSLPAAFSWWALGNRIEFGGDGEPLVVDPGFSRTSNDLVVWAVAPSVDGRAWWLSEGMLDSQWPLLPDGHAVATYQERPGGGRMVSLPSSQVATHHLNEPLYQTLLLNILNELS